MSDFITNLVRRSAGLLPETAVMPPLQPHFVPEVTLAAPNEPPIPEKMPEAVTTAQKTAGPKSFLPGTTNPSLTQPEAKGTLKPLSPTSQPPDQIKPDERPSAILSPRPQAVVKSVVTPHEATVTTISTPETKPIRQSTAQPPVQQETQQHLSAMVEAQITPNTIELPATPAALHQKGELTARNEHVTITPTPTPRPTLTTSSSKPDTAVPEPPSPIPIIQPTPTPHRPSPRAEAKVLHPAQPATSPSTVEVHIGAVEVRAGQSPTPTPPHTVPKPQGFGRYAQLRGGGERE